MNAEPGARPPTARRARLDTEVVDVGDETDEGDGDGPNDDEADGGGPGDGEASLGLERVDREVGPDDVLGGAVGVAGGHAEGEVVLEALLEHVGGDLVVELDEDGAVGLVRFEVGAELVELAVAGRVLLLGPVERVDLFAEETEEAELVGRAFVARDELLGGARVARGVELERSGGILLVLGLALFGLGAQLDRRLDELGLGSLQLEGGLLPTVEEVGHLLPEVAREPDASNATGEEAQEIEQGVLGEEVARDARDEDRLRLRKGGVLRRGDERMPPLDKRLHLLPDEVEDVDCLIVSGAGPSVDVGRSQVKK